LTKLASELKFNARFFLKFRSKFKMYAIVEIAGKQFRVAKDMKIKVPLLDGDAGAKVDFDRVFMVEDDKGNVTLGKPLVGNTSVSAEIVEHGREKKIIVFKKKRRKGYQKKNGHRQDFSLIEITGIGAAKKAPAKASSAATKDKPAAKAVKAEAKPAKKAPAKAEEKTTAEAAPAKKAPAKKAAAPKATAEKKPAAKTAAAKKPAAKKAAKPAADSAKNDVKED
jgi:large subunit ribosomal protein L21